MRKIPRHFKPLDLKLVVKRSRAGRGLFTAEAIPRGACVIEYIGRPATQRQMERDLGLYLFWTSKKTMIDGNIPENRARFVNHSCAPNCEIDIRRERVYIFAKRRILPGEELTYDYDEEYFDKHIKPFGCVCTKCEKTQTRLTK